MSVTIISHTPCNYERAQDVANKMNEAGLVDNNEVEIYLAGKVGSDYFHWLISNEHLPKRVADTLAYYHATMNTEYDKEADFLAKVNEFCETLGEECLVVREAAATKSGVADLLLCYNGKFVAW